MKRIEDELLDLREEYRKLRDGNQPRNREATQRSRWQMSSAEEKDAIPKFYPGEGPLMTVSNWTKTVDDLMRMHQWESHQTLYYGQTRLRGAAESWFFC